MLGVQGFTFFGPFGERGRKSQFAPALFHFISWIIPDESIGEYVY